MRRHELSDEEWAVIQPQLPNKPRGVPRVDDRRVINGILWRFRTGAPWRDIPERYGPRTTLYNRFTRWREASVWDRLLNAVSEAYEGRLVMIDSSCVRVHQHGAAPKKTDMVAWDVPVEVCPPRSTLWSMRQADPCAWRSGRARPVTHPRPCR